MSRQRWIVSAVTPVSLNVHDTHEEFWEEEIEPYVENVGQKWREPLNAEEKDLVLVEAEWRENKVELTYHQRPDMRVVEIVLAECDIDTTHKFDVPHLEEKLYDINDTFDVEFTLISYSYYTGGDKHGADIFEDGFFPLAKEDIDLG